MIPTSQSKPWIPSLALPSCTNHSVVSCPCFHPSVCLLTAAGASPGGLVSPILLGTMSNELSFLWQWSPDLVASHHWNNDETYILKHPSTSLSSGKCMETGVCTHHHHFLTIHFEMLLEIWLLSLHFSDTAPAKITNKVVAKF